jgi:WD40 repeat protein
VVAISPDNHWLVTGSADKTARLWLLQMGDLVNLARIGVGRNLSAYEWKVYFPGKLYQKIFPDLLKSVAPTQQASVFRAFSFQRICENSTIFDALPL